MKRSILSTNCSCGVCMRLIFTGLLLSVAGMAGMPAAAQQPPVAGGESVPATQPAAAPLWTASQASQLLLWLSNAPADGLPAMPEQIAAVQAALATGDRAVISAAADPAAILLLDRHRNGTHTRQRRSFGVTPDNFAPAADALAAALTTNRVDAMFASAVPTHPHYVMLRDVLATETDAARAATLRLNMDRWRWMPRHLGQRYLLVNVPSYEVTLWQDGQRIDRWRTIVGRPATPTNIFSDTVTGVVLNPWWEIPTSIANEGIASMVRNNPRAAAARGYVYEGGRYRQRPGPGNSLGQMKLVMPNDFAIYLHDTPSRTLFANAARAYSHGCVRVNQAIDFATAVLSTRSGWTRADTDRILATGRTETVTLAEPIPVYIAYFTTAPFTTSLESPGEIRHFQDIYGMDRLPR